jgi:hypothetical protein
MDGYGQGSGASARPSSHSHRNCLFKTHAVVWWIRLIGPDRHKLLIVCFPFWIVRLVRLVDLEAHIAASFQLIPFSFFLFLKDQ